MINQVQHVRKDPNRNLVDMHFRVEDVGADLGVDIGSHQDKALSASDQKNVNTEKTYIHARY